MERQSRKNILTNACFFDALHACALFEVGELQGSLNREPAGDTKKELGIAHYRAFAENEGIVLSKAYGNRLGVLPFTVIIDRKGNIIHRQRTELTFEQVEGMIKPLL